MSVKSPPVENLCFKYTDVREDGILSKYKDWIFFSEAKFKFNSLLKKIITKAWKVYFHACVYTDVCYFYLAENNLVVTSMNFGVRQPE